MLTWHLNEDQAWNESREKNGRFSETRHVLPVVASKGKPRYLSSNSLTFIDGSSMKQAYIVEETE